LPETLFADNGCASGVQNDRKRKRQMKHLKKVTVIRATVARANFFDDIGDWFHDLGNTNKIKW
jgi:hypothetical protein